MTKHSILSGVQRSREISKPELMKHVIKIMLVLFALIIQACNFSDKKENTQYLNRHRPLKTRVIDISFQRNGLYLNGVEFYSGGISGYTKFHVGDSLVSLDRIKPPFMLIKKEDNDTLTIIKGNQKFVLYSIDKAIAEGRK